MLLLLVLDVLLMSLIVLTTENVMFIVAHLLKTPKSFLTGIYFNFMFKLSLFSCILIWAWLDEWQKLKWYKLYMYAWWADWDLLSVIKGLDSEFWNFKIFRHKTLYHLVGLSDTFELAIPTSHNEWLNWRTHSYVFAPHLVFGAIVELS